MPEPTTLRLHGFVNGRDGAPAERAWVFVALVLPDGERRPLGRTQPFQEGRWWVDVDPTLLTGARSVGAVVQATAADAEGTDSGASTWVRLDDQSEVQLDIRLGDDAGSAATGPTDAAADVERVVRGAVRGPAGEPGDGMVVAAFDVDLRHEVELGRDTVVDGRYEIRYRVTQLRRREKGAADLQVRLVDPAGSERHRTAVVFGAPVDLVADLDLRARPHREPSIWEALDAQLRPALGDLSPLDLREDDEHRDLSFLAAEAGTDIATIATWSLSHRVAERAASERTPVSAEVIFAALRQGQPLVITEAAVREAQQSEVMILLENRILHELALLGPDRHREILTAAVTDNVVPAGVAAEAEGLEESMRVIGLRATGLGSHGGGKGTIAQLLALVPSDDALGDQFLLAYRAHAGSGGDFWRRIHDEAVLPPTVADDVQLVLALGALTRNHVPLVAELLEQVKTGRVGNVRDLARLQPADWAALLQQAMPISAQRALGLPIEAHAEDEGWKPPRIGVPANFDGEDDDERRAQYATTIAAQFARAYPTTAFAAKLELASTSHVPARADVVRFLQANPTFQIDRTRIEAFVAASPDALADVADREGTIRDLKAVQRVFRLNPSHAVVETLLSQRLDSAQKVYFLGPTQLRAAVEGTGVNTLDAAKMYRRAESTYALTLAMFGDFNSSVIGLVPGAVPSPWAADEAQTSSLPTVQALFGSLDYCECTDCRSVYSAAAYFVDVLRFLGDRGTQGSDVNAGRSVRDVLLDRRPDLGDIELSCENTNTALPYIDLVNEVLEEAVAPEPPLFLAPSAAVHLTAGPVSPELAAALATVDVVPAADAVVLGPDSLGRWTVRDATQAHVLSAVDGAVEVRATRQTSGTSAERRANPEHVGAEAYRTLASAVFPLALPFDLPLVQVDAFLTHLGVSRARLLELFLPRPADGPADGPAPRAGDPRTDPALGLTVDTARLGLSTRQRDIVTGNDDDAELAATPPWARWGLVELGNDLPHPDRPDDPAARVIGSWTEVLASVSVLLHRTGLTYQQLLDALDLAAVDPDGTVVVGAGADPEATPCDTTTFEVQGLSAPLLDRLHRFLRLWRRLGLEMWELDLLLTGADPDAGDDDGPITEPALRELAARLEVRSRTGLDARQVQSLYQGLHQRPHRDHGTEGAPAQRTLYQELFCNQLVDPADALPDDPSAITGSVGDHVPTILAALRITEPDLGLVLADLVSEAGLDAAIDDPLTIDVLGAAHRTVTLAEALGLEVADLLTLARLAGIDPFSQAAGTLQLVDLAAVVARSGTSAAELDHLLTDRLVPGVGLSEVGRIAAVTEVGAALRQAADEVVPRPDERDTAYVQARLGLLPTLVRDDDQVLALALVDGSWRGLEAERLPLLTRLFADVLDPVEAAARLGPIADGLAPDAHQAVIEARAAYVRPLLQAALGRQRRADLVEQRLADVLGLDLATTRVVAGTLCLPGTDRTLLAVVADERLALRDATGAPVHAVDATTFADAFQAVSLLAKVGLLAARLRLGPADVEWWLAGTHAEDLGWVAADTLPVGGQPAVPLARWLAFERFVAWRATLAPVEGLTALGLLDAVIDPTVPSASNLTDLARLAGGAPDDVTALAVAFGWSDPAAGVDRVKAVLAHSDALVRVTECLELARRLGVSVTRAVAWAATPPDLDVAGELKATIKAKYDLTQWQAVITPLQDALREVRRDALVAWLVAHPDPARGRSWRDEDGLYGHFLIDVEMGACMLTSRLKQAAASAQLFVQRCLLNLERDIVAATTLDAKWKQWPWMKRYRVWEANRKVFLYPENWIEPELRDEKSPFFQDLEQELQQNDVTAEVAESAYRRYLEKLDRVANLDVRAIHEEATSQDESILHVFARGRSAVGSPHYYRQRVNRARWLPWQPVDLDVNADHLMTGVHNRRLYLLWPQLLPKTDTPPDTVATPDANSSAPLVRPYRHWEIRLFWSELAHGTWTAKTLSDEFLVSNSFLDERPDALTFRTRPSTDRRRVLETWVFESREPNAIAPSSGAHLDKLGPQVVPAFTDFRVYDNLVCAPGSRFDRNRILSTGPTLSFGHGSIYGENTWELPLHGEVATMALLGQVQANATWITIDSDTWNRPGLGTFVVSDPDRSYVVDYRWTTENAYWSKAWHQVQRADFTFTANYHPFVELFTKELNIWGLPGLLNRRIQVDPTSIPGSPEPFDFETYAPTSIVNAPRPAETVDFRYRGPYSPYNWELFFHIPLFIADRLATNQRFEEALSWFHYVFDPTNTDTTTKDPDTPQQKFWITKPFYETTKADYHKQKIESILLAIAKGDAELTAQVHEWRDNPFKPHLIARMRTVAYQKTVLAKYVKTLVAWGDLLFGQDTIESVNEATQLYVLASSILGPRPRRVPRPAPEPVKTFYQLQRDGLDAFGNVLEEVEALVPATAPSPGPAGAAPELPSFDLLYFGIPHNDQLVGLWDTVDDRLFKIRHCMDLDGITRQLPLFDPPIDPAALVQAVAAGMDVADALGDTSAPLPAYRFEFVLRRAHEACADVVALGSSLLLALERRDAEGLARLRSGNEQQMLGLVRASRISQAQEADALITALDEARKVVEKRRDHYRMLRDDGLNAWETGSLVLSGTAIVAELVATVLDAVGAGTSLIPQVNAGASGFGGSPMLTVELGGKQVTDSMSKAADAVKGVAGVLHASASMTATIAAFDRRAQEWAFQQEQAEAELPQIDRQLAAARFRSATARQDWANQDRLIQLGAQEDEFLRQRFTNQELYEHTIAQLSLAYFQSYKIAVDLAKRAERCLRYELGLTESSYISFGYWDSLKQGLLAGEKLAVDLKRLEAGYHDQNRREYELTKHVSLAQLDPIALLQLRTTGSCHIDLSEQLFDLDHPGHYFRRLKSVSLSIPCTVGPYASVSTRLTLARNSLRKDATLLGNAYARSTSTIDPRFRDEIAAVQSIATSSAVDDSGLFTVDFHDERYLPFEGAGAISSWYLKLNGATPQFDHSTISDVVLHVKYTAREGGDALGSQAAEETRASLSDLPLPEDRDGLWRAYDVRREIPDAWYRFLHPAEEGADQELVLDDLVDRLPFLSRSFAKRGVRGLRVVARAAGTDGYQLSASPFGTAEDDLVPLTHRPDLGGLHHGAVTLGAGHEVPFGPWRVKVRAEGATDFRSLPADALQDLFLVVNYTVAD